MQQKQIQKTKQRSGGGKSPLPDLHARPGIWRTPSYEEIKARKLRETDKG